MAKPLLSCSRLPPGQPSYGRLVRDVGPEISRIKNWDTSKVCKSKNKLYEITSSFIHVCPTTEFVCPPTKKKLTD